MTRGKSYEPFNQTIICFCDSVRSCSCRHLTLVVVVLQLLESVFCVGAHPTSRCSKCTTAILLVPALLQPAMANALRVARYLGRQGGGMNGQQQAPGRLGGMGHPVGPQQGYGQGQAGGEIMAMLGAGAGDNVIGGGHGAPGASMPYNGPMAQMSSDHGAGGDSGVFDMSDSPSLGGPGLGGMGIGGMGGMGGMGAAAGSYQGTLHKLGSVAAPEFSIQHEDFPTLGGGPPSRGGGPPGPGPPGGGPGPGPPGGDLGNPGGSPGYQGGVQHYGIPQQYEQPAQQPPVQQYAAQQPASQQQPAPAAAGSCGDTPATTIGVHTLALAGAFALASALATVQRAAQYCPPCEVVRTKSPPLSRGAHERVSAIRYECIHDDI